MSVSKIILFTLCVLRSCWISIILTAAWLPVAAWGFDPYKGVISADELRRQLRAGVQDKDNIPSSCSFFSVGLRTHPWLAEQAIVVIERSEEQGGYGIKLEDRIKAEILLGTIEEDLDLVGGATTTQSI